MKGSHHLLLGLLTGILLVEPVMPDLDLIQIIVILGGIAIGSLAPDADTDDSAIMRLLLGYLIRGLVYYPLVAICFCVTGSREYERHRGILHSLTGAAGIGVVMAACLQVTGSLSGYPMDGRASLFGFACAAGAVLHLAADSATPGGVAWLQPLSGKRISGKIRSDRSVPPILLSAALALSIAAVSRCEINGWAEVVASSGTAALIWFFFLVIARALPYL
ncbi:MAG: metal-dependent hydrolase [Methanoculleaceae archaeon]